MSTMLADKAGSYRTDSQQQMALTTCIHDLCSIPNVIVCLLFNILFARPLNEQSMHRAMSNLSF